MLYQGVKTVEFTVSETVSFSKGFNQSVKTLFELEKLEKQKDTIKTLHTSVRGKFVNEIFKEYFQ
jgi:hypothetical protein